MMFAISLAGTAIGIIWSFIVIIPVVGFYLENVDAAKALNKWLLFLIYFGIVFALVWGSLVAYNICHVTYCGVFGRWYCKRDDGSILQKSLAVALTTSFGSIVLGSFLVALV